MPTTEKGDPKTCRKRRGIVTHYNPRLRNVGLPKIDTGVTKRVGEDENSHGVGSRGISEGRTDVRR